MFADYRMLAGVTLKNKHVFGITRVLLGHPPASWEVSWRTPEFSGWQGRGLVLMVNYQLNYQEIFKRF